MSVQQKKNAKAIRARYGVAGGVRPANGEYCAAEIEPAAAHPATTTPVICGKPAHVISAGVPQCHDCMKRLGKPRRR